MGNRIVLSLFFLVLLFLAIGGRRYIYFSYQHLGPKIGINFNNIATKDYVNWIKLQSGEFENTKSAVFLNKKAVPKDMVANIDPDILGQNTASDNKWIEIDLSEQRLYMKEKDRTVGSFLVSTGKWAPTPTGQGRIWTKLRYARMTGGSKALGTFYDLPNVPYTMYYDRGYGIHGAYWHNNFGQPMSHGCTNMRPEEAKIVFDWASVGTRVIVRD